MTKFSSSPAAYSDVAKAFAHAEEHGQAVVRLPTVGKAINFVQRCYRYRNLMRERAAAMNPITTAFAETSLDQYEIVYHEATVEKSGKFYSNTIIIRPRPEPEILTPEEL